MNNNEIIKSKIMDLRESINQYLVFIVYNINKIEIVLIRFKYLQNYF